MHLRGSLEAEFAPSEGSSRINRTEPLVASFNGVYFNPIGTVRLFIRDSLATSCSGEVNFDCVEPSLRKRLGQDMESADEAKQGIRDLRVSHHHLRSSIPR